MWHIAIGGRLFESQSSNLSELFVVKIKHKNWDRLIGQENEAFPFSFNCNFVPFIDNQVWKNSVCWILEEVWRFHYRNTLRLIIEEILIYTFYLDIDIPFSSIYELMLCCKNEQQLYTSINVIKIKLIAV